MARIKVTRKEIEDEWGPTYETLTLVRTLLVLQNKANPQILRLSVTSDTGDVQAVEYHGGKNSYRDLLGYGTQAILSYSDYVREDERLNGSKRIEIIRALEAIAQGRLAA